MNRSMRSFGHAFQKVFVETSAFIWVFTMLWLTSTLVPKATAEVFKVLGINPAAFCAAPVREADRLSVAKPK